MDLIEYIRAIKIAGTAVGVYANADRESYEFRVNGAVCAEQSYCGIRCSQDDPEFADYLSEIFEERAHRAVRIHRDQLGPIYI